MRPVMQPAWKNEATTDHFGCTHPVGHGIARVFGKFEPHTDCPDLFWQQWAFLPDEATIVPGVALRRDGGNSDHRQD